MIDLNKDIEVFINQKSVLVRKALPGHPQNFDPKDPDFIFDDFIDIEL